MQSSLLLLAKIGLLLLLWLFIWLTIRSLRKDAQAAATQPGGGMITGPGIPGAGFPAAPTQNKHSVKTHGKTPRSLVLTTSPLAGTTLNLKGYTNISIGRAPTCTLVLEDDFASGTHARLIRHGSAWYLEDVDSRNGTWIDGQRIDQPERLYAGSEFRVGQTSIRMEQ